MKELLLCTAVCLFCAPLFADTIYLDNGKKMEGSITVLGADAIVIKTEGGIEEIQRKHVTRIIGGRAGAVSPAAAAAPAAATSGDQLLKRKAFEPLKFNEWSSRQEKDADAEKFTTVKVTPTGRRIESVLKFSADLPGDHHGKMSLTSSVLSRNTDSTVSTTAGFSLAGETVGYLNDFLGGGIGIAYQLPRKMKDYDGNFNFLPLYAIVKIRTRPTVSRKYCYLAGHYGYSLFFGDKDYKGETAALSGGNYYGFGAGALFHTLNIEAMYTVCNGTFRDSGYIAYGGAYYDAKEKIEVQYSKFSVTIGMNFQ